MQFFTNTVIFIQKFKSFEMKLQKKVNRYMKYNTMLPGAETSKDTLVDESSTGDEGSLTSGGREDLRVEL